MANFAPIAVFIYKRVSHLDSTIRSLRSCHGFSESKIIVFGDGPKNERDRAGVQASRERALDLIGPTAEYQFCDHNRGLAASIINGVSSVVERYGRAIIIEDDLELAPHFLIYMNAALDRYAERPEVMQISGHMFDVPELRDRVSALFLPFTTTWGWATWRRAWARFDPAAAAWGDLSADRALRTRFNLGGAYDYSGMLERQMTGSRDSWGIRWYWSVFRDDGLVCFPPNSLVRNIGIDGSGTHGRGMLRRFTRNDDLLEERLIELPEDITIDPGNFDAVKRAIWRQNGGWIGASSDQLLHRLRGLPRRTR